MLTLLCVCQKKERSKNTERTSIPVFSSVSGKLAHRRLESEVADLREESAALRGGLKTAEEARDKFQRRNNALRRKIRAKDTLIDQHRLKMQKFEAGPNPNPNPSSDPNPSSNPSPA